MHFLRSTLCEYRFHWT